MDYQGLPQPNAIIFRLPDDDDGDKLFAEVTITADGMLDEMAQAFSVGEDDTFNQLDFSTIVLAVKETEDSSIEIAAFDIMDQVTGEPAEVWAIMESLDMIVPGLINSYNNGAGRMLQ